MSNTHHRIGKSFAQEILTLDDSPKRKEGQNSFIVLAKYSSVGYYLVTPLLLGVFFGLGIDKYLDSEPAFTLGGIILGSVGSFYSIYKLFAEK